MAQEANTLFLPRINVIPAGFRWTPEAGAKAEAKGAFLRVGGQQLTRRFLSGSKRSWANADPAENQTVFHTGYRITGTPENIRTALGWAGVRAEEIAQILDSTITRDNWQTTMAAEYAREIGRRAALKEAKPAAEGGYDWEQIKWFAENLKTAVIATKGGEQKGGVTSPGRAGAGESFADKVRKLAPGKVYDVSNMDIITGKGYRTGTAPKTDKAGKFGTKRVPIISNDINKYIRAIQLAYGPDGEVTYAADIEVVRGALANAGAPRVMAPAMAPAMAPVRTASPPRVPGATIAPAPVFTAAVPRVASPPRVGTVGGAGLPGIPALGGLLQR